MTLRSELLLPPNEPQAWHVIGDTYDPNSVGFAGSNGAVSQVPSHYQAAIDAGWGPVQYGKRGFLGRIQGVLTFPAGAPDFLVTTLPFAYWSRLRRNTPCFPQAICPFGAAGTAANEWATAYIGIFDNGDVRVFHNPSMVTSNAHCVFIDYTWDTDVYGE